MRKQDSNGTQTEAIEQGMASNMETHQRQRVDQQPKSSWSHFVRVDSLARAPLVAQVVTHAQLHRAREAVGEKPGRKQRRLSRPEQARASFDAAYSSTQQRQSTTELSKPSNDGRPSSNRAKRPRSERMKMQPNEHAATEREDSTDLEVNGHGARKHELVRRVQPPRKLHSDTHGDTAVTLVRDDERARSHRARGLPPGQARHSGSTARHPPGSVRVHTSQGVRDNQRRVQGAE